MRRILLAGVNSGSGKTTVTCAVLQALVNRGLKVASYKCGPDYIDPMFHGKVIGTEACSLDGFFCDGNQLRYLVAEHGRGSDISVIEGVMGYYDGVGKASTYQVAKETGTPVILVIDCKGMSRSVGAVIKGFLTFEEDSRIKGCIFNRLPESLVPMAQDLCHELGVEYIGRFPVCREYQIESRHLGLVTAGELEDIKDKLQGLARAAEEHLELDKLMLIAENNTKELVFDTGSLPKYKSRRPVKIAVAKDAAFCFYYGDNLKMLKEMGAELVEFSPLCDGQVPVCDGMILGGGYPELYARQLSENVSMRESVAKRIREGVPLIAECGGFLYLHRSLEDDAGVGYPMVGVIEEDAYRTGRLQRFGYVELMPRRSTLLGDAGEVLLAHEFHYWDSTNPGADYLARKASNGLEYPCAYGNGQMYAGFAHLHFYGNPMAAVRFLKACEGHA